MAASKSRLGAFSPPRPTRPHLHLLPPPPPLHFSSHSGCDLTTKREDVFSRQGFAPVIPSVHWSERRCVCLLVFAVSIALPQPSALPITTTTPPPPSRMAFFSYKAEVAAGPDMKDWRDRVDFFFFASKTDLMRKSGSMEASPIRMNPISNSPGFSLIHSLF